VQILNEKGYTNAFALVGGTAAWKGAGYPMEGESVKNSTESEAIKNPAESKANKK
jgi:3-mercaptopyruvate sulfurtransferase SseA